MAGNTEGPIAIVDRDRMSGGVLAKAISHEFKCEAAAIAISDLLKMLASGKVRLVIIGREDNGFELARTIATDYPAIPMIMLLDHCSRDAVLRAFSSGVRGVFPRGGASDDFMDCVEHVREGRIWAGPQESNYLLEAIRRLPLSGPFSGDATSKLTARETQVVRSAARGRTNKDIAKELHLSEHTVKNYLFKAFEKLGISRRMELLMAWPVHGQLPNIGQAFQESSGD